MAHPPFLVAIFVAWTVACLSVGVAFRRHAPGVSLGLFSGVLGAMAGFLVGRLDGPAGVPANAAVGASLGLFVGGIIGSLAWSGLPPSAPLRRTAALVLINAPFAAAALTVALQGACPLYVTGKRAGYCAYQGDLLGDWLTGVIMAFLVDALFVAGLLFVAAQQARQSEYAGRRSGRATRVERIGPLQTERPSN